MILIEEPKDVTVLLTSTGPSLPWACFESVRLPLAHQYCFLGLLCVCWVGFNLQHCGILVWSFQGLLSYQGFDLTEAMLRVNRKMVILSVCLPT
jgi:hypothetical protein